MIFNLRVRPRIPLSFQLLLILAILAAFYFVPILNTAAVGGAVFFLFEALANDVEFVGDAG